MKNYKILLNLALKKTEEQKNIETVLKSLLISKSFKKSTETVEVLGGLRHFGNVNLIILSCSLPLPVVSLKKAKIKNNYTKSLI